MLSHFGPTAGEGNQGMYERIELQKARGATLEVGRKANGVHQPLIELARWEVVFSRALVCFLVLPCSILTGADGQSRTEMAYVSQETSIYDLRDGKLVLAGELPVSTTVRAFSDFHSHGSEQSKLRRVQVFDAGHRRGGWVACDSLAPLSDLIRKCESLATPGTSTNEIPTLIQIQPERVKEIWTDIQNIIERGGDKTPEPFLARALLWKSVHNHERAVSDYLKATTIMLASEEKDLSQYVEMLGRLQSSLADLDRMPLPPHPGLARDHYANGYHQFREGEFSLALIRFTDAVELNPHEPGYRYFRALTLYRLGDHPRAEREARIGGYLESKLSPYQKRGITTALGPVQGRWRLWLEEFRLGDPHFDPLNPESIQGDPFNTAE